MSVLLTLASQPEMQTIKHFFLDYCYVMSQCDDQNFYIAPKYRQQGIGREAALQALELYHGRWVISQLEKNLPARVFWQTVLTEYTRGRYDNLDGGTQQRFSN